MYATVLFFLVLTVSAQAQRRASHVFEAENITAVVLESDEVYKISLKTAPVVSITVNSRSDGEYFNQIQLDAEVRDQTLYLNSKYPEILRSGYDNLSAHKVFAMEIDIVIPESMNIELRSNLASVFVEGFYSNLYVELRSGSSFLDDFRGNAVINTYDGNIVIYTPSPCKIEANSRYGVVSLPPHFTGGNHLKLTSIKGDINVQETK